MYFFDASQLTPVINEAPIAENQRRISLPDGAEPTYNSWVTDQGLSASLGAEFPLADGALRAY